MKTLSELKDLVAQDFGYKSFASIPEEADFEMIEELIANRWNAQKTLIADHRNAEKALAFKTMTPDELRKFEEDWHNAYELVDTNWTPGADRSAFELAAQSYGFANYTAAMCRATQDDFKKIIDRGLLIRKGEYVHVNDRYTRTDDPIRMTTETTGSRTTVTVEARIRTYGGSDYFSLEGWEREKALASKKARAKLITLPWLLQMGTPLHLIIAKRLKEITLVVLLLLSFTATHAARMQPVKPAIWVSSQHRKAIRLTDVQTLYLRSHAPRYVQSALANYAAGGTIRNNETADIIYALLKDAKLI